MTERQRLTQTDIAALSDAAGIALSEERLATVTDLANRFRDSVEVLRDYLAQKEKTDGNGRP
ncbi:MAG: hypothetical protein AB7P20_22825 [Rhizobiaceae bacterium]